MKMFYLVRKEDESGVSGTGRVAQGFVFDNGRVSVTWLSEHPSTTVYDNIGEVRAIHGHEGKTEVVFEPDWKRAYNELKSAMSEPLSVEDLIKGRCPEAGEARKLMKTDSKD